MILADSSVWVDYLRGAATENTAALDIAIGNGRLVLGDLIVTEVLRGVTDERIAALVWSRLRMFDIMPLCGPEVAVRAAESYRILRVKGETIRGTLDLIIGTWCIMNAVPLIHADRDFEKMERWLGLVRFVAVSQ